MNKLIIKSNRVILPGKSISAYVIIENGIISDIVSHYPGDFTKLIDVGDKVLMPGVVDTHVHINEPGRTHWEGFDTATRAALAGGITTLVDMPLNSSPVTTTITAFEEKLKATENKLHVNCGFWGGIVPGSEIEIEGLIKTGVLGFKAFLTHSGIDDFPNVTEADLRKVMPLIAKNNLPLLVHCELSDPAHSSLNNDDGSYQNYLSSRPKKWEDDAIALMIDLCGEFDCRVHIVHLSSADSIDQIRRAKQKGLPLTVETAQHYLFFTADEIKDRQTAFKCAPPIREKENRTRLWDALKEGIIDFVATDHSPAPPDLKELQTGNFTKAWGGIASLQWALPVLWTGAKQRGFGLTDLSKWLCENPSKLPGGKLKKGRIEKGYEADFVVFDPNKTFIVKEDDIHHHHKISPYLNHELSGVVEQTWLGGIKVFDKGEMTLGRGKILLNNFY
ncbi:MAG: allantoinase AllB [Chitinophagaceae bacterium]|nr:allantoinase AllB [Chitinophagaceae bacterium]